jgi:hypothetical protein
MLDTSKTKIKKPADPEVEARQRGAFAGDVAPRTLRQSLKGSTAQPRAPPAAKRYKKVLPPVVPVAPLAMSIKQFAAAHDISIDTYFHLQREGVGPAVMKVGGRTLISFEAAAVWRREREEAVREHQRKRKQARATAETPP